MAAYKPNRPRWTLTNDEFTELRSFLAERTGLSFSAEKQKEFQDKLQDYIYETGTKDGRQLIQKVRGDTDELQKVVNDLTIGESYFFRNRPHFEALKERIIPELIQRNADSKTLDIWSSACATGEEPYSLAILIKEYFPQLNDWTINIYATDINTSFLNRASEAKYNRWSFRGFDEDLVKKYFNTKDQTTFRLSRNIADTVQFSWFNLANLPYEGRLPKEKFDLVLCRNVLIYFSFDFANQVVGTLAAHVKPNGFLVVGHAESFPALSILELVYSNATYYYHHSTDIARRTKGPFRTLSIPGLGVTDIEYSGWLDFDSIMPIPESPKPLTIPPLSLATIKQRTTILPSPLDGELARARVCADNGEVSDAGEVLDALCDGAGKLDSSVHFLKAIIFDQSGRTREAVN